MLFSLLPVVVGSLLSAQMVSQDASSVPAAGPGAWRLDLAAGARENPLGARVSMGLSHRRSYGRPWRVGWPRPYGELGLALSLSPASATTALHAEWMPQPFFVMRVQGDLSRHFGCYGGLLAFPEARAPFGDEAKDALSGREQARFSARVLLQPTLRVKLGPVLVQNQTDLAWYAFGEGGPYFLSQEYDTLLADGDGLVANRSAVLAELWARGSESKLWVGPSFEVQRTFVGGLVRERVGAVLLFCPWDDVGGLRRPRLVLQAGINLRDPNRSGQLFLAGGLQGEFGW